MFKTVPTYVHLEVWAVTINAHRQFAELNNDIVQCTQCPRLIEHCRHVAKTKRRAYADWDYWGKPVPGFGDAKAKLLVVALAPAAHGGNRTGRMFTGGGSASLIISALHKYGFANQSTSQHRDDDLQLHRAYMANVVRCAPPANRPTAKELQTCQPYFERELALLTDLRVVLVLGHIAFNAYRRVLLNTYRAAANSSADSDRAEQMVKKVRGLKFRHGAEYELEPDEPRLIVSYHPSRQNTQTGRLTEAMFYEVIERCRTRVDEL